ncbi:MAG: hypothetical protein IJD60_02530, partial [Clostridia bacterium]|nr:hypothetical protein [Clostridia bacterium]
KPFPGSNPPRQTAPIVSKPALNTPNCAYFTQFPLKKANRIQKNPSGIVSIPDGFHGGSRRIRTLDLPGMKYRFSSAIIQKSLIFPYQNKIIKHDMFGYLYEEFSFPLLTLGLLIYKQLKNFTIPSRDR